MRRLLPSLVATLAGLMLASTSAGAATTLNLLIDNNPDTVAGFDALVKAFEKHNPDIKVEVEQRPGGGEGDNIIKTRLATGEMADVFLYNSGSLMQALKPDQTLTDLTDLAGEKNVADNFKKVVSAGGKIYGVPYGPAMGGGILYNRKIYQSLGLAVPKTWGQFIANNAKIKAAGKVAVVQTYKSTWTSQLFVLADFFNVSAKDPSFAEAYTANKAKYATTPVAMKGFEHLAEVNKAGFLNADFGAATYNDGLKMLAVGEGAHYPMLTFAIGVIKQNHPDNLKDIGFFAQPGDDAAKNGLTVWMPPAVYVPKTTTHLAEAKKFLDFLATTEACDLQTAANGATGPYLIKGCKLPADVPPAVADLVAYFDKDSTNAPALEFLSPVKGPALEQITVEVGSGIRAPADGAALYDADVRKEAKQLGLPNW